MVAAFRHGEAARVYSLSALPMRVPSLHRRADDGVPRLGAKVGSLRWACEHWTRGRQLPGLELRADARRSRLESHKG